MVGIAKISAMRVEFGEERVEIEVEEERREWSTLREAATSRERFGLTTVDN